MCAVPRRPAWHHRAGRVPVAVHDLATVTAPHSHQSSTNPTTPMNTAPKTYSIRVDGHLDDHWSAWLGELDMTRNDDGTTTITTQIADQAQLHGLFAGLRDIGAVITELHATP